MHSVSELYGKHEGEDIYVLGTGTSVRVFPLEFLKNKVCVGLNMAWKLAPVQYGITIRPELNIPEFLGKTPRPEITWITKHEKLIGAEQQAHGEGHFYFFDSAGKFHRPRPGQPSETGRELSWVRQPSENHLYVWTSIAQTAANFAANLGAKNVILVGCDNCALEGNHHAHEQHTLWKGEDPSVRYRQYYQGLAEVRGALRERGVNLLSLTPFLALNNPSEDFLRLCGELGANAFIDNPDVSEPLGLGTHLRYYAEPVLKRASAEARRGGKLLRRVVSRLRQNGQNGFPEDSF